MPERIQLRRTRGWRKPEGSVVVARPSGWGNPHRATDDSPEAHQVAVELFHADLLAGRLDFTIDDVQRALGGHDLACWCAPGLACHADVLLEAANRR